MFDYNDPDKTRKMQKRAARFADTLDNKKARSRPLALQINQFVSNLLFNIFFSYICETNLRLVRLFTSHWFAG